MKVLEIDGEIGYDFWTDSGVTLKTVQKQAEGLLDGEEIKININSPGGSVYDGVVIFNYIRDIAKTHPVSVEINGIAMSMASYIALAARTVDKNSKITVHDNSVIMIHNPWTLSIGDYRVLRKDADYLEKLAAMYGAVHSLVSGKNEKEIRAAMDTESYYVGKEIVDAGFANDFDSIKSDTEDDTRQYVFDRKKLIAEASNKFYSTIDKAKKAYAQNKGSKESELERVVALCGTQVLGSIPRENTDIGEKMKAEELLAKDKACYDEVLSLGGKLALEKERLRVLAHIKRGEKTGAMDIALKHIQGGGFVSDEDVNEEYFNAALDKRRVDARIADNPEPLNTAHDDGTDDAQLYAAFDAGTHGKDFGGR